MRGRNPTHGQEVEETGHILAVPALARLLPQAEARSDPPMVPQNRVIVWQLRGKFEDVVCYFVERSPTFTLTVERAGERLAEERYATLDATMARARQLRRSLVQVGFETVAAFDGEPPSVLDSLLRRFVREGTTALHASQGT
jgi:hypothetical protein